MDHPVPGGRIEHQVTFHHIQGTSGPLDFPDALKRRIACLILLSYLPEEGLPEALESLGQMWQFYRVPVILAPALPAPPARPAKLGTPYVRPVFPVTEE